MSNVLFAHENYRVVACSDGLNVTLEKLKVVKPKGKKTREDWVFCGYYSKVLDALKSMADELAKDCPTLNNAIAAIEALHDKVDKLKDEIKEASSR